MFQGKGSRCYCYSMLVPQIYLFLGFHVLAKAHFFWLCNFLFLSLFSRPRHRQPILEVTALSMLASPLLFLDGCADRWNSHWSKEKTIAQIFGVLLNKSLSSSCGALWWWWYLHSSLGEGLYVPWPLDLKQTPSHIHIVREVYPGWVGCRRWTSSVLSVYLVISLSRSG